MGLENNYKNHNIILSFNALAGEEVHIDSYVGSFENIYASLDNLYITNNQFNLNSGLIIDMEKDSLPLVIQKNSFLTNVYRFEFDDDKLVYRYKTIIPGRILNPFSMDEYNGYFRIVSTYANIQTETLAYNFKLDNNQFTLISQAGGMGIDEQVYSVRFEKELCYVVTFRQIDPLYIVDYSDPNDIKIIGELKTPGYSTYLHKYSDTLLIGIGMDTDENGRFIGGKISLYDVSNLDNIQ